MTDAPAATNSEEAPAHMRFVEGTSGQAECRTAAHPHYNDSVSVASVTGSRPARSLLVADAPGPVAFTSLEGQSSTALRAPTPLPGGAA